MVLLIGAGPMAVEYAKVLLAQNLPFICITRSKKSADSFYDCIGVKAIFGGIDAYINEAKELFSIAIVATGMECLADITITLLNKGVRRVLVEKPAGMTLSNLARIKCIAGENNSEVYVAYNRRFYSSVKVAEEMIKNDGGISSLNYEITEWAHVINAVDKAPGVKEKLFTANTSHVIDLAFFLGGRPKEFSFYRSGSIDWHPSGSQFSGAGVTELGALFSYSGNWQAPGRWRLECLTSKNRYIFSPMELLHVQKIGSVDIQPIQLMCPDDINYKPGLYAQVSDFINCNKERLCGIDEHIENMNFYYQMAGYASD